MTTLLVALASAAIFSQDEFFPLKPGITWTYKTNTGRDYVKRVLGVEKVEGAPCAILQLGETEKHWLTSGTDGVRLHRSKGISFEQPLLLFKYPLTRGETWKARARATTGIIDYSFSTIGEEEVEVPAGRFKAWRIEWKTEGAVTSGGQTWLARGYGPVKEAFAGGSSLALVRVEGTGDTYLPLRKGHTWVYKTENDEETDLVREVTAVEKVGEIECLVVEHRSVNAKEDRVRILRKEWLASSEDGVRIHRMLRGRTVMTVDKPFFKLKSELKKDDEWEGEATAAENPAKHHYRVGDEEMVEVPAGKFKAVKVAVKIESGERNVAEGFDWYSKNVGLVKSEMTLRFGADSTTIVAELKEFKPGK